MKKCLVFSLFLTTFFSALAHAQTTTYNNPAYLWEAASSLTYDEGDYGTGTATHTIYMPVTISRNFDHARLDWTIPFVYKSGSAAVSFLNGHPIRTGYNSGSQSASGLGDLLLKGSYYFSEQVEDQPLNTALVAQEEFPTADDKNGLGTGEFDEMLGIELNTNLTEEWKVFTNFYYTFLGNPSYINFRNQFAFDAGCAYKPTANLWAHLYYEQSLAIIGGTSDEQMIFLGGNYQWQHNIHLFADLGIGFTENSPAIGITGGAGIEF